MSDEGSVAASDAATGTSAARAAAAPVDRADPVGRTVSAPRRRVAFALGVAVLPLLALVLSVSWMRWPDVLVDFGRELYVPWRMTEGDVLYRDLAYFNGPLSPSFDALVFEVFGVGARPLMLVNLALLGCLLVVMQRYLAALASNLAANAALLFFVAVFAAGQQVPIGNYNFLAPYSHEATHGTLLAFAALALAAGGARRAPGAARLALAGLALGLTFLTKSEVFVAALVGVGATVVLTRSDARARALAIVGGCACVAPLVAVLSLSLELSLAEAARAVLAPWWNASNAELRALPYYRIGMGLDAPGENAANALLGFAVLAGIVGGAGVLGRLVDARACGARRAAVALAAFLVTLVVALGSATTWRWLARSLPLDLVAVLALGAFALRGIDDARERRRLGALVGFACFALALFGKMALQGRFGHYGFFLAAPASLCVLVALVDWAPRAFSSRAPLVLPACALGLFAACGADLWSKSAAFFATKTTPIGRGRDAFVADGRAAFVERALLELDARIEPGEAVLVLPEGITINYLARRPTPTPYVNFMPPELILFGEQAMLDALAANPPAAIVVVHKDTSEYGARFFGTDYAMRIGDWVRKNYAHAWTDPAGGEPLRIGTDFGVSILTRTR